MRKVNITEEMILNSKARGDKPFNNFSFMGGRGNLVGFLGQELIKYSFPEFKLVDAYDYDFEFNGIKIEVKTKTQTIPTEPLGYYEASIAEQSSFQNADVYIFCRIFKFLNEYKHGWIVGWIDSKDFYTKSRRLLRGQVDGDNGYVVKENCYNIRYDQLNGYE